MRKRISTLIFLAFLPSLKAWSQKDPCHLFSGIKFKNGTATVVLRGTFDDLAKSADYTILKELDKEKRLKYSDYGVDTGEEDASSGLAFIPEHCATVYFGTLRSRISNIDLNTLKHGIIYQLTCEVFEGNIMGNKNYFVINQVNLAKTDDIPYPPITDKRYLNDISTREIKSPSTYNFFTFANIDLSDILPVFAVSGNHTALIKFNKAYIHFKLTSHIKTDTGYIDKYDAAGYKLILTINNIKQLPDRKSIDSGTLRIISKNADLQFAVHGGIVNK